jgi:hypothetical protein
MLKLRATNFLASRSIIRRILLIQDESLMLMLGNF